MFGLNYIGFITPNLSCQINLSWSIGVAGEKKSGNSICALLTHILKVFVVVHSFSNTDHCRISVDLSGLFYIMSCLDLIIFLKLVRS